MNEDFEDVEIYVRPADAHKGHPAENVWEASYEDMARFSTRAVAKNIVETAHAIGKGQWEVGIRERGDEQYSQHFESVEPHAEERADALLLNHLHGVLNHWRW